MLTDEQVQAAIDAPPSTTRAALRGRFITAARAAGQEYSVDWTTLKLNDRPMLAVSTKDPFATTSERLDDLLAALPTGADAGEPTRPGSSSIRPV